VVEVQEESNSDDSSDEEKVKEIAPVVCTMSLEDRKAQSLREKIENALPILMKYCPQKEVERMKRQVKDDFEDLYILPNGGYF